MKKPLTVLVAIAASTVVLTPRPAHAFKLLDNILDVVGSSIGVSLGDKLNDYLQLGLGKLDKLLGLDTTKLESITGVLGGVDPIKVYQQIDIDHGSLTKEDLAIPSLIEGKLKKAEFSAGLAGAIGNSLLTTEAQEGFKAAADGVGDLVNASSKLAAEAKKSNVTQKIAQIQAEQNAQQTQVLADLAVKEGLGLQQAAATTAATGNIAANSNAEERRQQEIKASEQQDAIQRTGFANGVLGGL